MNLYLDIETLGNQDEAARLLALDPFQAADELRLKLGNIKDPDKAKPKVKEAVDRMALDKLRAVVLAIGVGFDEGDSVCLYNEAGTVDGEEKMLRQFSDLIGESVTDFGKMFLYGWNHKAFDVPMLRYRAMKYGLVQLRNGLNFSRYDSRCIDLMEEWAGTDWKTLTGQKAVCQFFGIPTVGVDGSQVGDMWRAGEHDEIKAYCLDDVHCLRELAKLMGVVS